MPIHRGRLCEWSIQNNSLPGAAVLSMNFYVTSGLTLRYDFAGLFYCLKMRLYHRSSVRPRSLSEQTNTLTLNSARTYAMGADFTC